MSESSGTILSLANRDAWIDKNATLLGLDWEQLPQLPAWGPLFGYTQDWHRLTVIQATGRAALVLKRRLEPAEKESLSTAMAANNVSLAYTPIYWLTAGLAFERLGHKRFRFPFFTPKNVDPLCFPSKRFPIVSGPLAVAAWHSTRFTAYAVVSSFLLTPLVTTIVTYSTYSTFMQDPNLKAFHNAMKKLTLPEARKLDSQMSERLQSIYETPEDPSMRDASAPYFGQEQDPEQEAPVVPDAPRGSWARLRGPGASQEYPQGKQSQAQQQQQQQQPAWYPPSQQPPSSDVEDDGYLFDDASPVAPTAREQRSASAPPPPPSGSAWARLRQGAQQESNNQGSQQGGSQSWAQRRFQAAQSAGQAGQRNEGYAFSQEEQESSYAKEQAQRDFDAMLERERRGEADESARRR